MMKEFKVQYCVSYEFCGKNFTTTLVCQKSFIKRAILNKIIYYKIALVRVGLYWTVQFELNNCKMMFKEVLGGSPEEVIKFVESKLQIVKVSCSEDNAVTKLKKMFNIK